jgi:TctA family transporter
MYNIICEVFLSLRSLKECCEHNILTPWGSIRFQKLIVVYLTKKLSAFMVPEISLLCYKKFTTNALLHLNALVFFNLSFPSHICIIHLSVYVGYSFTLQNRLI